VRGLFERAGARGAWVKIESAGHLSAAAPEGVAGRAENALAVDSGHVQTTKVEKRVTRISFRVSAKSDTHRQGSDIESNGIAATALSKNIEPVVFEPGFTSFLSLAVEWAAFILIFAVLSAAVVAWMSLQAGSPAHLWRRSIIAARTTGKRDRGVLQHERIPELALLAQPSHPTDSQ
jgi:hypothetical protein